MSSIKPYFIFGFAHSGTSLMQNIFEAHGSVYKGKNETYFYDFPHHYNKRFSDLSNLDHIFGMIQFCANVMVKGYFQIFVRKSEELDLNLIPVEDLKAIQATLLESTSYSDIFHKTCDFLARKADKTAWVEKTPGHTFHATRILREISGAKAVALIRDPRDILASRKTRERRLLDKYKQNIATSYERQMKGLIEYDPLWTGLSWRSAFHAVHHAAKVHPDSLIVIRYEDLTSSPESTIRDLCDFLDLEFRLQMLDVNLENVATMDKTSIVESAGIVQSSEGRWRTGLSKGEAALTNWLLRKELRAGGYDEQPLSTIDSFRAALVFLRSVPNLFRRMTNKFRYQGWAYAWSTSKYYLKRTQIRS